MSEFYKAPPSGLEQNALKSPIPPAFLEYTVKIKITNRSGDYQLHLQGNGNKGPEGNNQWFLDTPRKLPANQKTVTKIITALKNIRVKKVLEMDALNMTSFSIDSPQVKVQLENQRGETIDLQIGIINPIDHSAYIAFGKKRAIYQVELFKPSLETLDTGHLVDSHIFSSGLNEIREIHIYKGKKLKAAPAISYFKKDGQWTCSCGDMGESGEGIGELLHNLVSVKGQVILDRKTGALEKIIQKFVNSPLYTIELLLGTDESKTYLVSDPINNSLEDLKIQKMQNILIRASDKQFPYIVSKDYLSNLQAPNDQEQGTSQL